MWQGGVPIPEGLPKPVKALLTAIREKLDAERPHGEEPGCFPPGMLLGAAWNPEVVYRVGEAVAREAMAYNVDVLLGTPNTNIQRDPKNGRVFESFSEDPYLSSQLAPAFSRSVQDQGMVTDVKHFAANNQETLRQGIDETISERALRELLRYTDTVFVEELGGDTDVVIITAGASGQEGKDRPDMDFDQEDKKALKKALTLAKSAGKKVILLLNVAGPVELVEYMEDIDALICVYFPGMEGARALADILFGKISPSGKLPITFPKTYRQTPTAINFPGEYGRVNYGEGIFVGYRYYDYKGIDPLYPFGFGLSYSAFSIKDASLSSERYDNRAKEPLLVRVKLKNEGAVEAKEVVQLYIHSEHSRLLKPERSLRDLRRFLCVRARRCSAINLTGRI